VTTSRDERVNHWTSKISNVLILGLFFLSLVPQTSFRATVPESLRAAILQMQRLHHSSDSASTDFTRAFSSTVVAMQAVAGLRVLVTNQTDPSDTGSLKMVVCTRIPYLKSTNYLIQKASFALELPSDNHQISYQSHLILPELPPPIYS
jgi:hypothetical protein